MPENQEAQIPPAVPVSDHKNRPGRVFAYVLSRFIIALFVGIGFAALLYPKMFRSSSQDYAILGYAWLFLWGGGVSFTILLLLWKIKIHWQITILGTLLLLAILWRYIFG